MTDARKEAIEQVAKDTEMLPGSVDHWAHHPQYGDEKLRSAVDGWERAIVRGRLLRETEAALSELFLWTRRGNRSELSFGEMRQLLEQSLSKIRAELEVRDGTI